MREIKFRGKRKDNGKWIYGHLIKNPNATYIVPCGRETSKDLNAVEVVPETVGQLCLHDSCVCYITDRTEKIKQFQIGDKVRVTTGPLKGQIYKICAFIGTDIVAVEGEDTYPQLFFTKYLEPVEEK